MRLHSGLKSVGGLLFLLALSLLTGDASVLCCDVGQQVLDGLLIHWHGLLIPVVKVDLHALELIHQDVTALVALHDASGLPSSNFVEELSPGDAYLAYE